MHQSRLCPATAFPSTTPADYSTAIALREITTDRYGLTVAEA